METSVEQAVDLDFHLGGNRRIVAVGPPESGRTIVLSHVVSGFARISAIGGNLPLTLIDATAKKALRDWWSRAPKDLRPGQKIARVIPSIKPDLLDQLVGTIAIIDTGKSVDHMLGFAHHGKLLILTLSDRQSPLAVKRYFEHIVDRRLPNNRRVMVVYSQTLSARAAESPDVFVYRSQNRLVGVRLTALGKNRVPGTPTAASLFHAR